MSRGEGTRDLIAAAALAFVDEHGVDALTLRALGQATGMHHTAVYRHFKDRNEVLAAVNALVMAPAIEGIALQDADPRARLLALIREFRATMREHPAVTVSYLLPTATLGDSAPAVTFQSLILAALREFGLRDRALLLHYRILESYVLGASVFDFGGAPDHLEVRRARMRAVGEGAFEEVSRDTRGIDELNEAAFDRGLVVLVDECVRAGQSGPEAGARTVEPMAFRA